MLSANARPSPAAYRHNAAPNVPDSGGCANEVASERMQTKSLQKGCKRSRFRRRANEVASERMQTKSPQKECKRSRFRRHAREPLADCKRSRFRRRANESRCRKNANEVASERMQTKSLQNTCKRSRFSKNANEVASERMQTKSLQKECKRSRCRKNASEVDSERMQTKWSWHSLLCKPTWCGGALCWHLTEGRC